MGGMTDPRVSTCLQNSTNGRECSQQLLRFYQPLLLASRLHKVGADAWGYSRAQAQHAAGWAWPARRPCTHRTSLSPTTHVGRGAQPLQAAGSDHSSRAQAFPTAPGERCGSKCKGHGGTHKHSLSSPLQEEAQQGTLPPGRPSTLGHQGLTARSFSSVLSWWEQGFWPTAHFCLHWHLPVMLGRVTQAFWTGLAAALHAKR